MDAGLQHLELGNWVTSGYCCHPAGKTRESPDGHSSKGKGGWRECSLLSKPSACACAARFLLCDTERNTRSGHASFPEHYLAHFYLLCTRHQLSLHMIRTQGMSESLVLVPAPAPAPGPGTRDSSLFGPVIIGSCTKSVQIPSSIGRLWGLRARVLRKAQSGLTAL